jgi:putative ABC transport system permease protein
VSRLFGIPVGSLALVLVATLVVALGAVAALALRNRIFLRLGIRNIGRRRGRSALIVTGLMLGTAIIAAALATGDTMSQTIRSSAVAALGRADLVVGAKGMSDALAVGAADTPGIRYFPEADAGRIARAASGSGLVSGVAPVIVEPVAVQDLSSRQNEPRVTLFAGDAASLREFAPMRSEGKTLSLAGLRAGEVYLNSKAADKLDAHPGDTIHVLAGSSLATVRVRAIVSYQGTGTSESAVLMPLAPAQRLLGKPGLVKAVFVALSGGPGQSDRAISLLRPALTPLGLEADNTKQDALDAADATGAAFMSLFTTFGSFSIAAGILLIFLIFVMLSAERRSELGIARAVGTRRRHLVQTFLFEGLAYDLLAALVGALIGLAVAYGMVFALASAFASQGDFHIAYSVKPASVALAYALGVLLTLVVVAVSAWRVSRMTIVTAIRNLAEPPAVDGRRRRLVPALLGLALGALLAFSGVHSRNAVPLGLGVSLVILSLVPVARLARVPERVAHTAAGLALLGWFVLPISRWLLGDLKVNFSIFLLGGLMIVIGATWTIVYNADALLGLLGSMLGRIPRLAPVVRMSIAYPLRGLFRTGVTLAMFTLVVFTLVVGATTTGSFMKAFNDMSSFGGGYDILATASPASPIRNVRSALAGAPGLNAGDFRVVSSESSVPVKARQLGTSAKPESYVVHGVDAAFLDHTTYRFAATARGYDSPAAVWRALREHRGLAVVDQFVVPRRQNWNFGAMPKFQLHGFFIEDRTFEPVRVSVRDPQTGRHVNLTVIGVLSDSAPLMMAGIWTSQQTLSPVFGDRVVPTTYRFALRSNADAEATAKKLESAFLANGLQADALRKLLDDAVAGSLTIDRLIEGFMGLGLIVGVAALGVITARAVVERRQQIGVLRAIGFSRRMVQLAFLLESSFVALTAIAVGTGLGLVVAHNVIGDSRRTASWENMSFAVPWVTLGIIFLVVYAVAMATTFAPARRASRIYPAEALRYQ